ncbi:MAG: hypothetical protein A2Y33_06600 [Spirochaetes bacterium GWF1_51_8]|nr:MAG: hypothetical protein A2Y33_06600 [Spirochaetes bacterium GWF1_51_8]
MKSYLKKHLVDLAGFTLFACFVAVSWAAEFQFGIQVRDQFVGSFLEMAAFLPLMFILVGLFDVWVPRGIVERHIGQGSGIMSVVWMVLLATLQAGPFYGALPVAYLFWKKGASARNIFIYLGAFSTMKIPMLSFEIGYLGLKFSLLRTLLTLPVFIIIALIMDKMFGKNFEMFSPETDVKKK